MMVQIPRSLRDHWRSEEEKRTMDQLWQLTGIASYGFQSITLSEVKVNAGTYSASMEDQAVYTVLALYKMVVRGATDMMVSDTQECIRQNRRAL